MIEIVRVAGAPAGAHCGGRTDILYEFLFNVFIVNTTLTAAVVQNVSSAGIYETASPDLLGTAVLTHSSLPFTPLHLRARDGEGHTTVSIAGQCPAPAAYGSINLRLFITTDQGQFATNALRVGFGF